MGPVDDCPCGGERSARWHRDTDLPVCEVSRLRKVEQNREWRQRKRDGLPSMRWQAGTSILVEEMEEL